MYDVIVIGGGLVGASAAYRSAALGARVGLIDREDNGQATAAGAGILTPGTTRNAADGWWRDFAFPAVAYYPELLELLRSDGETDIGYSRCGLLHVAVSPQESEELRRFARIIADNKAMGAPAVDEIEALASPEAAELFPPLGEVDSALHVSGACRVDGRLLLAGLRRAAARHGVELIRDNAARLLCESNRVAGVELSGGEVVNARKVIVAAGAWTGALVAGLGAPLPVTPQRGQIAHLQMMDGDTANWPVVMGFHSHYIVSFPNGRVVAGATREGDSRFNVRTTAGGVHEVLGEALRIAPGLAPASLLEVRVGLRPVTPDARPVIGPVPSLPGAYVAAGHGPSGLQLGPFSGKVIAELALDQSVSVDLEPFRAERFAA